MIPVQKNILETVAGLRPTRVLDVGCGCGSYTVKLAEHCRQIIAVDSSSELIERCRKEHPLPNVHFQCEDATRLSFPDEDFEVVLERATLHHIGNWPTALSEMIRIAYAYIFVEEPIDDLRNEAKRRTYQAQELYLEVQREVGYSHYRFLHTDNLTAFFDKAGLPYEYRITKSDEAVGFDEFFEPFPMFARQSPRPEYWMNRLAEYKETLPEPAFCRSDLLFIMATKRR